MLNGTWPRPKRRTDQGVTLVGYALIVSLIAVFALGAVQAFGLGVNTLLSNNNDQFDTAGATVDPAVAAWSALFTMPASAYGVINPDPAVNTLGWPSQPGNTAAVGAGHKSSYLNWGIAVYADYGTAATPGQKWLGQNPTFTQAQITNGDPFYFWQVTRSDSMASSSTTFANWLSINSAAPGDPLYPPAPIP